MSWPLLTTAKMLVFLILSGLLGACVDRLSRKFEYTFVTNGENSEIHGKLYSGLLLCASHLRSPGLLGDHYSVDYRGDFDIPGRKSQKIIHRPGVRYLTIYFNNGSLAGALQFFELENVADKKTRVTSHSSHKFIVSETEVKYYLNEGRPMCRGEV